MATSKELFLKGGASVAIVALASCAVAEACAGIGSSQDTTSSPSTTGRSSEIANPNVQASSKLQAMARIILGDRKNGSNGWRTENDGSEVMSVKQLPDGKYVDMYFVSSKVTQGLPDPADVTHLGVKVTNTPDFSDVTGNSVGGYQFARNSDGSWVTGANSSQNDAVNPDAFNQQLADAQSVVVGRGAN